MYPPYPLQMNSDLNHWSSNVILVLHENPSCCHANIFQVPSHVGWNRTTDRAAVHSSGAPRSLPQAVAPTATSILPLLMAAPVLTQYRLSREERSQLAATASPPATKAGW